MNYLCYRIVSMEQSTANRFETAAHDRRISSSTENVLVWICIRTPGNRLIRSSSEHEINTSVAVTITDE